MSKYFPLCFLFFALTNASYGSLAFLENYSTPASMLAGKMRPESCKPRVIVHEDFESAPLYYNAGSYFYSGNPSHVFSDYIEDHTGNLGSEHTRIETIYDAKYSRPSLVCNTTAFGGNVLFIDSKLSVPAAPEPVGWGKTLDYVLPSGSSYSLSFWMISNSAFNANEIKAYLRNANNNQKLAGQLVNSNGNPINLDSNGSPVNPGDIAVNNPNLCGTVIRYSFPVLPNASAYNQLIIVVSGSSGDHDVNIDEITLTQDLTLAEPVSEFTVSPGPYISDFPIGFSPAQTQVPAITNPVYFWDWGDGSPATVGTTAITVSHSFPQGSMKPYKVSLTVSQTYSSAIAYGGMTCAATSTQSLPMYRPLCEATVPAVSTPGLGEFKTNPLTGSIDFVPAGTDASCRPTVALECLGRQGTTSAQTVSISMTAYADTLVQDDAEYREGVMHGDPFLQGRGQLRPYATYTFQAPLEDDHKNYTAGTFSAGVFSPSSSARARPATWITTAVAERVSPNGDVLQERDPLGVRSVAKYGYGRWPQTAANSTHVLPYLQAHHTEASTVLFESFENTYDAPWRGEDQFLLLDEEAANPPLNGDMRAHTGLRALLLKATGVNAYRLTLKPFPLTTQLTQEGLLVKCWLYLPGFSLANVTGPVGSLGVWEVNGTSPLRTTNLNLVAQTGDWCLAEAQLPLPSGASPSMTVGTTLVPRLTMERPTGTTTTKLWIDDIRMQPGKAQMTTYVYDPRTSRLLATFDDQHYALLYQYNSQGQLIRKQAETARGVKTLQETFYHTPLEPKP